MKNKPILKISALIAAITLVFCGCKGKGDNESSDVSTSFLEISSTVSDVSADYTDPQPAEKDTENGAEVNIENLEKKQGKPTE